VAAWQLSPEDLDLLVLDMGAGELAPLQDLPHVTAYVGTGAGAREQRIRLIKYLRAELGRRRAEPGDHRRMIVLVDGLAAIRDEFGDPDGMALVDSLSRVYADGPALRMHVAVATSRSKAVPAPMEEATTQRWLYQLADAYDYSAAGIRPRHAPAAVPGRFVSTATKLQAHVATPADGLASGVAAVAAHWSGRSAKPTVIGQLPTSVSAAELGALASLWGEPRRIPVGIRESDLGPAWLEAYEGEHILIAGPARSGKSTLLLSVTDLVRISAAADRESVDVWGLCGRRSPLAKTGMVDRVAVGAAEAAALIAATRLHQGRLVLLIDDAERFDDEDGAIAGLLSDPVPGLLIIAADRKSVV
jgi:S-DNA-T family DNA segregation ATPase FtsK/SpoIIIE